MRSRIHSSSPTSIFKILEMRCHIPSGFIELVQERFNCHLRNPVIVVVIFHLPVLKYPFSDSGLTSAITCVIWGDDVIIAGDSDSVLLYTQSWEGEGSCMNPREGDECSCRNREAPVCAAKFDMWTCTGSNLVRCQL